MKKQYTKDRKEVEVGCKYANDCFECPFDDCVIPMDDIGRPEEEYLNDREILMGRVKYVKSLRDEGLSIRKIAQKLRLAEKTVKKDLIVAKTLLEGENAKQN